MNHKESPHSTEVPFRKRPDDSQYSEGAGGDKKNLHNTTQLIHQENRTERSSIHDAINNKHDSRRSIPHFFNQRT